MRRKKVDVVVFLSNYMLPILILVALFIGSIFVGFFKYNAQPDCQCNATTFNYQSGNLSVVKCLNATYTDGKCRMIFEKITLPTKKRSVFKWER